MIIPKMLNEFRSLDRVEARKLGLTTIWVEGVRARTVNNIFCVTSDRVCARTIMPCFYFSALELLEY